MHSVPAYSIVVPDSDEEAPPSPLSTPPGHLVKRFQRVLLGSVETICESQGEREDADDDLLSDGMEEPKRSLDAGLRGRTRPIRVEQLWVAYQ